MDRIALTTTEAAIRLGLCAATVRRLARAGELPCRQLGRKMLFSDEAIKSWLDSGRLAEIRTASTPAPRRRRKLVAAAPAIRSTRRSRMALAEPEAIPAEQEKS